jgi:PAS domain S-box-containing protein
MLRNFSRILENISDVITVVHDAVISYQNASIQKQLGYKPEELIGGKIFPLIHPSDIPKLELIFAQIIENPSLTPSLEIRWLHQQGSWHLYESTFQSFFDDQGKNFIVLTSRDLSERQQQEVNLKQRARLSNLAGEIGIALGKSNSLPQILNHCTRAMLEHLEMTFAGIWILNRATRLLELQAFAGEQPPTADFADRVPLGIMMVGFIGQYKVPYISKVTTSINTILAEDVSKEMEKVVAVAGYPLMVENNLVGVLALCSNEPITEEIRELLGWVVNAIAIGIDRARYSTNREALLLRLTKQIRNSLDVNTILETAVQEIQSLLQVDRCLFAWYREGKKNSNSSANLSNKSANRGRFWQVVKEAKNEKLPSLVGNYLIGNAGAFTEKLLNLEMLKLDDVNSLTEPQMREFLKNAGFTSILATPLQTISGEIGVVCCGMVVNENNHKSHIWRDNEIELLKAVTDQLAIALDQAELYSQAQKSAEIAQAKAQQLTDTLHQLQTTQTQLVQTEKMSSLGQMIAGIAHEINNPLSFISGNIAYAIEYTTTVLHLLKLYQDAYPNPIEEIERIYEEVDINFITEDLAKLMLSMKVGTERIDQIVKSLRNFSRVDEADKKPVDIHEGLENTLLLLQHRFKAHGKKAAITLIKDYGKVPLVECYAGQLNQVFMNILSNAIDALENNPEPQIITITTRIGSEEENNLTEEETENNNDLNAPQYMIIRISDNGPGMPEEVKNHSFDPFFTTKPVGKGTGLGLSIAHHIVVEKHRGILKCISEVGLGTEFSIKIPLQFSGT